MNKRHLSIGSPCLVGASGSGASGSGGGGGGNDASPTTPPGAGGRGARGRRRARIVPTATTTGTARPGSACANQARRPDREVSLVHVDLCPVAADPDTDPSIAQAGAGSRAVSPIREPREVRGQISSSARLVAELREARGMSPQSALRERTAGFLGQHDLEVGQ